MRIYVALYMDFIDTSVLVDYSIKQIIKAEEVYAYVGYPVEMEEFISYMSPKGRYDPTKY